MSNYGVEALTALLSAPTTTTSPAVNQCQMSLKAHDDATITFCQSRNITYEAYQVMKGCPFDDATVQRVAGDHNVSVGQVCERYILQRGCAMAVGTGANSSTAGPYAAEDLDVFGFSLTDAEMKVLNSI